MSAAYSGLSETLQIVVTWAVLIGGGALWIRNLRLRRSWIQQSSRWPQLTGTIERVEPFNHGYHGITPAFRISYSYEYDGDAYAGTVEINAINWFEEPDDNLRGQHLQLRVDPKQPEHTVVIGDSVPHLNNADKRHDLICSGQPPTSW